MRKFSKQLLFILIVLLTFVLYGCGEKTYSVKLILDGSEHATIVVSDGQCLKDADTKLDLIQYDFDGWYLNGVKYNEEEPIHSDLILTGETIEKEYTIKFINDNDNLLRKNTYAPYEEIIAPTNPKKTSDTYFDYTFAGWDTEFDLAKSDMTIKATYTASDRYYSVKIDNNGNISEQQVKAGDKAVLPIATKNQDAYYKYTFWQWIDEEGTIYDETKGILKDSTLYPKYHLSPTKTSAKGLTISIVGDSISTHYREGDPFNSYYNGNNTFFYPKYSTCLVNGSQTWWGQTVNKLEAKLGINNSWSGTTCSNNGNKTSASPAENDTRLLTLNENGEPDIIITYIGTNDWASSRSVEVFYKSYMNMITKIKKMYPNAYVFCVTLGYSTYTGESGEGLRVGYNEAIKQVCDYYDATVIDWATIQNEADHAKYKVDRLHLNYAGMTALSNLCVETINDYLNNKE